MRSRPFSKDADARMPFAVLAIIILLGSSTLSGLISQMDGRGRAKDIARLNADPAFTEVEGVISGLAARTAAEVLREGLAYDLGPEEISALLTSRFVKHFSSLSEGKTDQAGTEGWTLGLVGLDLGIDLGALPDGEVVGTVNWTGVSPDGVSVHLSTKVSQRLGASLALAYVLKEQIQLAGDEGATLARVLKGMLFKLGTIRAMGGQTDASKVLTAEDVDTGLRLALGYVMSSSTEDVSNMLVEERNITTIKASSILAQYLVGLLDYYLLWFMDYSGTGEGADAFFHWIGVGPSEDQALDAARSQWYEELFVGRLVERWSFEALSAMLHMLLLMSNDEYIDVRGLSTRQFTELAADGLNATAEDLEVWLADKEALSGVDPAVFGPPAQLQAAFELLPSSDPDDKVELLGVLETAVKGSALEGLSALIKIAKGLAIDALKDVSAIDEMYGVSGNLARPLRDSINDSGKDSPLTLVGVQARWSNLSFTSRAQITGVHDTAPEDRLAQALSATAASSDGSEFSEIRPYETDYHIRVTGSFEVHRLVFPRTAPLSAVLTNDAVELGCVAPINISIVVPVLTGVPLSGADYTPSDTLKGDLREAAWEFLNTTWAGLGWASGVLSVLVDKLVDGVKELGRRGLENLGRLSAGALSRTIEDVLRAVHAKAWDQAINTTWEFLRELIGEDLEQMLTFNITIWGLDLRVSLDVFDEVLTIGHVQEGYSFELSVKRLAELVPPFRPTPVAGYRYALLGSATLRRGDLSMVVMLDPLTVVQSHILQVVGELRDMDGKGYRFELDAPVAERPMLTGTVSLSSVLGTPIKGVAIPGTGLSFDIDAGMRARYGPDIRTPEKLLAKALRKAWYETLEGYSVRELYDDLGDLALLEAFFAHLLNNVGNSLEDVASEELPEVELFIEGEVSSTGGIGGTGFCLSFVIKEPVRFLRSMVLWILENLRAFVIHMASPGLPVVQPAVPSATLERLYVRMTLFAEAGMPEAFGMRDATKAEVDTVVEANLPALATAIGSDKGRWMVNLGIVLPGVPSSIANLIPGLEAPRPRCDLWLLRLAVMELDNDRAKISEVYYDTDGYDPLNEFVELWNPTSGAIDVSSWVLADRGGRWRMPDHSSVPAGGRIVIARDRDGFRGQFHELPDASGLALSLNNDGDVLTLYDPWGIRIDSVAWEGGAHGWNTKCKTGQSLQRGALDTDTPMDWRCGVPDPGR